MSLEGVTSPTSSRGRVTGDTGGRGPFSIGGSTGGYPPSRPSGPTLETPLLSVLPTESSRQTKGDLGPVHRELGLSIEGERG